MFLNKIIILNKMKKENLFLIFMLIIFINSCNQGTFSLSGSNGIEIKFLQPENIVSSKGINEGDSIPIEIELTNKGECPVDGILTVRDSLSDNYGGVFEQQQNVQLNGIEVIGNKPRYDSQIFVFSSSPYSGLSNDAETNLLATMKYNCDFTTGPKKLCVQSPYYKDENKCKNFETISGSNIGSRVAPITVSKVEKQLSLGQGQDLKLNTVIYLTKMSKGKVYSRGEDILKGGIVKFDVDYGGYPMSCRGKSLNDYKDGVLYWKNIDTEKIINCEILLNSGEFQENPLNVHLGYDYEITESKLIKINNIQN